MSHPRHKLHGCIPAFLMTIALAASPLRADITGMFNEPNENINGTTLVQAIDFDVANVADIAFEANFFVVDAGIQITVNGATLFETPNDVSQFGPANSFVSTPSTDINGAAFDNLGFAFNPLPEDLPRLTVTSDSTGTIFSGNNIVANDSGVTSGSPTAVTYATSFSVANFTSLLNPDSLNTIEIFNLNGNGAARLDGDFSLTGAVSAIPEPSSLPLLVLGSFLCMKRRRCQRG